MKVRDARFIINSKKREQRLQKSMPLANNGGIVDAREILKSKHRKNSNTKFKGAEIPTELVRKEIRQVLKSLTERVEISKWKKTSMYNKHVEFNKGGLLTVTSERPTTSNSQMRKPIKLHQTPNTEKTIVNNRKSIVVIKQNELLQNKLGEEPMEIDRGDDLENSTLDDFPDIKSLPRGLSSSLRTSSQNVVSRTPWKPGFSSITNEMAPVNTMVADTVANSKTASQQEGYTVCVTNLHDLVTQEDIVELFSDVGPLASAQLLQPGNALVVYYTKAEASQACDLYHNRLLDGQPMQCVLLQSNVPTGRSSLSSRLGGKLVPGSSALPSSSSAVLPATTFRRSHLHTSSSSSTKSSQSPVQFTVKLP